LTSSKASCNLQTRALNVVKPLKFTIASDLDAKRQVQERIMQEVARCGYDADDTFAIKLALEEALMNAMKHGNKLDRSKKVHVQAKISRRRAEITVEDEGPGFDRRSVPDPTTEENLCKCSGRGILLIEAYMNKVIWSKHGRRVKMIKLKR